MFGSRRKRAAEEDKRLERLCSKSVGYVTVRSGGDPGESVIGRAGYINRSDGRIIICCGGAVVFDRPQSELEVGELLSKNGVTFTFREGGAKSTVTAYYSYYRKL